MTRRRVIAVIGAGDAEAALCAVAREVGREIAARGAVLVNGGRGGVMKAAAQGTRAAGGHTLGILPGYDCDDANEYIEFAVATGMHEARNVIVVASADAVIALAGESGTLSEIAMATKLGRPVVALNSWPELTGLSRAADPAQAVKLALELAAERKSDS
jgi:uncharacterized protein (TIGR00725 family)